jgi:hypothetical protein
MGTSEKQESFHPNHNGHRAMANSILSSLGSQSLLEYSIKSDKIDLRNRLTATIPSFFKTPMDKVTQKYMRSQLVDKTPLSKFSLFTVRFDGFKPNSHVKLEIHSEPTRLGDYIVDSQGQLVISLEIPSNVPAGYHTLYAIGEDVAGELISMWQTVEVQGVVGDIDEDGIIDASDPCVYVNSSGVDSDADGVDDGCDSIIEEVAMPTQTTGSLTAGQISTSNHPNRDTSTESIKSNDATREWQAVTDELFYVSNLPIIEDIKNTDSNRLNVIPYIVTASVLIILVSIWALKRYSTYKDL